MSSQALEKTSPTLDAAQCFEEGFSLGRETTAARETIGERLARLRKERGITQKELAERLGVTQPLVSGWERGELRLHGEMILEISQILAVTPNEILGAGERKAQSTAAASRRLLRRLQALEKLPKRDQEAVLRTIDAFLVKAS